MKGLKENACGKRPHKKLDCGKQKVQKTIEEWELTRQCHMRHGRWGEWDDSICWKPRTSCRRCCTACNLLRNEAPCFQFPFLRLLLHHPCLCPLHCRMHPCRKKASKQRTQNPPKQSSAASELRLRSVVVVVFFFFFAFVFLLPSSSSRASYLLTDSSFTKPFSLIYHSY